MAREIDRFEVQELLSRGAQLVEVLPREEYDEKHIAGAKSLPLKELGKKAHEQLDESRPVITYCYDSLCDMSGRAAARLEGLGFREVYDYHESKVDWFGSGLPAEGKEADRPTIADVADPDVPTCHPTDTIGDVRTRLNGSDTCVVVDDDNVVLGLIRREALAMDEGRTVEQVMQEGPLTHRPDVTMQEMAEMLEKQPEPRVLVTNGDGTLVGIADPDEIKQSAKESAGD